MDATELKKFVQKGFDEASVGYDKPAMRFFDNSARHLVSCLSFRGDERVLDVATGTGKIALELARRLDRGHVTGVDLSEGMLRRAREKAGDNTRTTWRCLDVLEADFPEHSFDGMCCGFGVFFWPDMAAALRKLLASVKPGGFFAMTSFADGSFMPQSDLCLKTFQRYGVKPPETYTWHRLDSPGKHRDLLVAVGLEAIESHVKPMGYYLSSSEDWWDLVTYTGFRSLLTQLAPDQVERYRTEHLKEIAATADDKGIYLYVDVIFTQARVPEPQRETS